MNKLEVQQRVLQYGRPLSLDKFTWCEETSTFSSREENLVIDFTEIHRCTFKAGGHCVFKTASHCAFKAGYGCIFNTEHKCTFDTEHKCTFDTGSNCIVIRRDIYEVIELEKGVKIKLNGDAVKGFTIV